jgi:HTH-type transcriptional regulator/antitoxin HipB
MRIIMRIYVFILRNVHYYALMDTAKIIGRQLRERRRALGITQAELAVRSELSRRTITAMEKGETDITLTRLLSVLQVLGMQLRLSESDIKRRPTEAELQDMFKDEE